MSTHTHNILNNTLGQKLLTITKCINTQAISSVSHVYCHEHNFFFQWRKYLSFSRISHFYYFPTVFLYVEIIITWKIIYVYKSIISMK